MSAIEQASRGEGREEWKPGILVVEMCYWLDGYTEWVLDIE